jgi:GAF domain-containing protein
MPMTDPNVLVLNTQAHIRTPEDLLAEVLPQIVEVVDKIHHATLYRLSREGLVLWYTTDETQISGTYFALKSNPNFQEAIEQQDIIIHEDEQVLLVPLFANSEVFALLSIHFEEQPDLEQIQEFANDLGLALHTRHLHRLVQRQMSAMALLNTAETLTDVAKIVAQTMAEAAQYIGMNVFEFDDNGQINAARVITTANRREAFEANVAIPLDQAALQSIYDSLVQDGDILINDVSDESQFSDEAQKWLLKHKAKSAYLIAMPISGRLFAFLSLIDTKRSLAPTKIETLLFQNVAYQAAAVIEKQEFLEQTRHSAEQASEQVRIMQLLNDLVTAINQEQDEKNILHKTVTVLLEVTQADHIGIVLNQENRGILMSETPNLGVVGLEVELGVGSISETLKKQRKALIITDIANDSRLPQTNREALEKVGAQSCVILPMFDLNNRLLGTVGIDYYTQQDSISPTIVDLAQTFIAQTVSNISRVRLLAQSQQQAKQLQHITDFGQKLRAYLGIEEIVNNALHTSRELLELDYVAIMIYDRQSDSLRCVGEVNNEETWVNFPGKFVTSEEDMIASQAWSKREMMYIDDLHADWEWKHPKEQALQTVIAQPLSSAGVVLGVMEIGHRLPSAYNAVDITTFQQMSNQLAIALSNAEAYAQSQKLARNKSIANDIITRIQQQPDVKAILEVTVHELGQALRAKRGRIRLGSAKPQSSGEK